MAKNKHTQQIRLRLTVSDRRSLMRLAAAGNTTMSRLIRKMIRDAAAR